MRSDPAQPKKICQLCNLDFTLYHFLMPLLRGMRETGHEVVGVCSEGPYADKAREEGFRVEAITIDRSFNILKHLRSAGDLTRMFRREKFDIVHVHNPVAALVGRLAAWRAGVPLIVYTAHGFYFHDRMPWPKRTIFVALEWLAGRVTDVLFTQSAEDAETARQLHLISGGHIEAIGNGVDTAIFHNKGTQAKHRKIRREIGSADDRVVILSIGRLVAEKGFPELISAMRDVDADLWIVGERLESDHAGNIDRALELARTDPELKNRIRFLGYRNDVADLMRASDMYVLASHREGLPRSIIEAMMCGLPVVATDIRGSREEVVNGETGMLVPVNDPEQLAEALSALSTDAKRRKTYGEAGRKRALELYDERKVVARQITALGL
ncbi:MAG: glycosyltransferase family 4 protein [Hyphomicrobiaceae bacterium]|nr:glycosyltransferase family 4 protein [Hyphomicrobiaceae bacterium]